METTEFIERVSKFDSQDKHDDTEGDLNVAE